MHLVGPKLLSELKTSNRLQSETQVSHLDLTEAQRTLNEARTFVQRQGYDPDRFSPKPSSPETSSDNFEVESEQRESHIDAVSEHYEDVENRLRREELRSAGIDPDEEPGE